MFKNIIMRQGGKRILDVSITHLATDKRYFAAVTVPLGRLLPAGLTL